MYNLTEKFYSNGFIRFPNYIEKFFYGEIQINERKYNRDRKKSSIFFTETSYFNFNSKYDCSDVFYLNTADEVITFFNENVIDWRVEILVKYHF